MCLCVDGPVALVSKYNSCSRAAYSSVVSRRRRCNYGIDLAGRLVPRDSLRLPQNGTVLVCSWLVVPALGCMASQGCRGTCDPCRFRSLVGTTAALHPVEVSCATIKISKVSSRVEPSRDKAETVSSVVSRGPMKAAAKTMTTPVTVVYHLVYFCSLLLCHVPPNKGNPRVSEWVGARPAWIR